MGLRLSEGLNLDRLAAVSGLQLEGGIVRELFDAGCDRALGAPACPLFPSEPEMALGDE
jgi:hypothetical protein